MYKRQIVDSARVYNRMKVWPNGILHFIHSARHEVLMEDIATQKYVIQEIVSFFESIEQSNNI